MNLSVGVLGVCFLVSGVSFAQQPLTNASVSQLAVGGIGESLLFQMIQKQPGTYDVSATALVTLKQDGVSDRILTAMISKTAEGAVNTNFDDLDAGVYFKQKGKWIPVAHEHVNWKTGGVLKSIFSDRVVKGDINGHIEGAGSVTSVGAIDFMIKTTPGVDGTDFQLVCLHDERNGREFRLVTGGVFHASGGATRDEIEFGQTKIAEHIYKLTVPELQAGEYAFLAPGLSESTASGSMGKAYTFHLTEAEGGWQP
jgi:hypothetical protein